MVRNRRHEMRMTQTKVWTFLASLAITFLLLQMHFMTVKQEDPPHLNLNHPEDFFEIQDAKRKSSHLVLDRHNWNTVAEKYVPSLLEIRVGDVQHPHSINSKEREFIMDCLTRGKDFALCNKLPKHGLSDNKFFLNIGMSVINIDKTRTDLDKVFKEKFIRNLESLLEFSSVKYLHFIFVTDSHTLQALRKVISHLLSRRLALNVIQDPGWRWRRMRQFPVVKVSYADINHIVGLNQPFTAAMKNVSKLNADEKYSDDLFYIAPMYHGAFLKLDKLIYLDCSDIVFFDDIKLLSEQFSLMGKALIGVGLDKSPHYRSFLGKYVSENPNTKIGLPGEKQGFNTGVVLFDLNKMRNSALYNGMISPERVKEIQEKYRYKFTLGDQDWFTNVGWDHPEMFYILPCQFNSQTSVQYLKPPWEETFEEYHHCVDRTKIIIHHRNGCGPAPEHCGYTPDKKDKFWRNKSHVIEPTLDTGLFWESMRRKHLQRIHRKSP